MDGVPSIAVEYDNGWYSEALITNLAQSVANAVQAFASKLFWCFRRSRKNHFRSMNRDTGSPRRASGRAGQCWEHSCSLPGSSHRNLRLSAAADTAADIPYYPINDEKNSAKYKQYRQEADKLDNVLFYGRLAEYKYYYMHQIVEKVLLLDMI